MNDNKEETIESPEEERPMWLDILLVYGWAILVVIVAIIALIWYGVITWPF